MPEEKLKQDLLKSDPEYKRLSDEHQDCEERLDALLAKATLSEEDELAAKQIKRHKLFLKDRLGQILQSQLEVSAAV